MTEHIFSERNLPPFNQIVTITNKYGDTLQAERRFINNEIFWFNIKGHQLDYVNRFMWYPFWKTWEIIHK